MPIDPIGHTDIRIQHVDSTKPGHTDTISVPHTDTAPVHTDVKKVHTDVAPVHVDVFQKVPIE